MKDINPVPSYSKRAMKKLAVAGSALVGFMAQAHAALPTAVSTELETAKTDVGALCALVFAIAIVITTFAWFRRGAK